MPRTVTLTFSDGSSHVYNGVPDDVTPDAVISRAGQEFAGKQVTNIDGGKAPATQPPAPTAEQRADAGLAGLVPKGEAFTAPVPGTMTPQEANAKIAALQKQGVPRSDPQYSELEKQAYLGGQRQMRGGAEMMVAGPAMEAAGGAIKAAARPGVAAGVDALKAVAEKTPFIGKAIGRESALAKGVVVSDAKAGVTELAREAKGARATKDALDATLEGRPTATVLDVQKPPSDTAAKVSQAIQAAKDAARKLGEARANTEQASQKLSQASQFAGPKKSYAMERAARRDLAVAKRDEANALQAHNEAKAAREEAEEAHRAAVKSASKQSTTPKQIASAARSARGLEDRLTIWANELNNAKKPEQVAKVAKKIGDQMFRAGKLSAEQHNQFLERITKMVETAETTKKARERLVVMLKGAGIIGGVSTAAGVGYEIRRF